MSQSDYYGSWVERHKHEDEEGRWWRTENEVPVDGPYTEEKLDEVLWEMALDGDAMPSPP